MLNSSIVTNIKLTLRKVLNIYDSENTNSTNASRVDIPPFNTGGPTSDNVVHTLSTQNNNSKTNKLLLLKMYRQD